MRIARSLATLALALEVCACSLDRRELRAGGAGGSDSEAGSGSQAGDTASASGGSSGSGSGGNPSRNLVDGCADLDTDGVADCTTTLVSNAAFSEDVSDWQAQAETELVWHEKNAFEDRPSGSAQLTSMAKRSGAAQCAPLQGRQLVITYASAFVEDDSELGQANLLVSFFENPECAGESGASFETPPSTLTNAWTTIQAGAVSPEGSASMSLALVGVKPDGADASRVYFDNVMLKTKELK